MLPILNRNMHFTYAAVGVKEQSFEQYNFPMGLSTLKMIKKKLCFYGEQIHIWSFWCSLPTICKHILKSFPFHFLHLYHTPISLVIKAYSQVIPVCPASLSLPVSLTGERFFLSVNWLNSLSLLIYWTCEQIISPVPQLSSSSLSQLHPSYFRFLHITHTVWAFYPDWVFSI